MAEATEEMELISLAIRRLMEEDDNRTASHRSSGADAHDLQLLSRLLSQVESTREEQRLNHSQISAQQKDEKIIETELEPQSENVERSGRNRVKIEKVIVKELKEVKRQNFITHCLVSAMIILTVAWQVSEVSFILKLRNGLSNPFKSLGTILKRKTTSAIQHQIEATELPHLNMPALPHVNLPEFDLDGR
ncbi:uncharacterized protein LOC120083719 [Benincasa hispida]|uniref:uncharacterized protein LOC120083719 n=1 Tax=Benincasa hispida TaxID=102211 RepID=UPI001901D225|nr:uncharacterized protein LOC120083719 [Benincasa hispida]